MTSEELNRTIEFIIESQARLAAAEERDREDLIDLKRLSVQVVRMLDLQSERLDRQDVFYRESLQQSRGFQDEVIRLQHETLRLLNRFLICVWSNSFTTYLRNTRSVKAGTQGFEPR
jgi:hypothetical protein